MPKKKTLKEQESFSFNKLDFVQVKKDVITEKHNPQSYLKKRKVICQALAECLLEGDYESFQEIWSAHLSVMNKKALAEKTQLSRTTIYDAMKGNPTLKTLCKITQQMT